MAKKMTPKNLVVVTVRFMEWFVVQDKDTQADACELLGNAFDEMADMDMFGTEGQNDPRGDQR